MQDVLHKLEIDQVYGCVMRWHRRKSLRETPYSTQRRRTGYLCQKRQRSLDGDEDGPARYVAIFLISSATRVRGCATITGVPRAVACIAE